MPETSPPAPRPASPLEAAFYGRVSGDHEESIEIQLAFAREVAARDGYFIPDRNVYSDVRVSGDVEDRPGFKRLDAHLVSGAASFDRLYVRDRARFSRWSNPRLFDYYIVHFKKQGVVVRFCDVERHVDFSEGVSDEDVGHYIVEKVENVGNAKERTSIGRKMRRARRQHLIDGAWPSGSWPFALDRVLVNRDTGEIDCLVPWGQKLIRPGFRYELRFATDRRIAAVKLAFDLVEQGLSYRATALELNARQLPGPTRPTKRNPTPPPGRWTPTNVSHLVRNRVYIGTVTYAKFRRADYWRLEPTDSPEQDSHDPIVQQHRFPNPPISEAQFKAVRAIVEAHHYTWERRRATRPRYLLTGKVRCAVCGRTLQGRKGIEPIYTHLPQYADYECSEISKSIHGLDRVVLDAIREIALDPDLERRVQEAVAEFQATGEARQKVSVADLEDELTQADSRLAMYEADLGVLTQGSARTRALARVAAQADVVDRVRSRLETERANYASVVQAATGPAVLLQRRGEIRKVLDSTDLAAQRILVAEIAERISVRCTTRQVEIALRYA